MYTITFLYHILDFHTRMCLRYVNEDIADLGLMLDNVASTYMYIYADSLHVRFFYSNSMSQVMKNM